MSPLYCNTILGCLNARAFIMNGIHRDRGPTFQSGIGPASISPRVEHNVQYVLNEVVLSFTSYQMSLDPVERCGRNKTKNDAESLVD
jgi:hypothetical protein